MPTLASSRWLYATVGTLWMAIAITVAHADAPTHFSLQLLITDSKGTPVPNAAVIFAEGSLLPSAPIAKVGVMDQKDEQFVPPVLIVPMHTDVSFPNSDNTRHQIYSFSPAKTFELPLYRHTEEKSVLFDKPGVVHLGCNIHDNMQAHIIITSAPLYGVSNQAGELSLQAVRGQPPERVQVYHPQFTGSELSWLTFPNAEVVTEANSQTVALRLPFTYTPPMIDNKPSLKDRLKQFRRNDS